MSGCGVANEVYIIDDGALLLVTESLSLSPLNHKALDHFHGFPVPTTSSTLQHTSLLTRRLNPLPHPSKLGITPPLPFAMSMFSSFGNMAKQAADQFGGEQKDDNNNNNNNQQESGEQKWSDVGSAVKEAFEENKERQAKGESVAYAALGGLAKKAAAAYNSGDGPQDAQSIGKSIAAGFMGGNKTENKQQQQQQQQPPPQQQQQQEQPPADI